MSSKRLTFNPGKPRWGKIVMAFMICFVLIMAGTMAVNCQGTGAAAWGAPDNPAP